MKESNAGVAEALVGTDRNWYQVLCATRDYMSAHGAASRWPRLHKELVRHLTPEHFLTTVREHIKTIPVKKET